MTLQRNQQLSKGGNSSIFFRNKCEEPIPLWKNLSWFSCRLVDISWPWNDAGTDLGGILRFYLGVKS